jgi:hypothetical protein
MADPRMIKDQNFGQNLSPTDIESLGQNLFRMIMEQDPEMIKDQQLDMDGNIAPSTDQMIAPQSQQRPSGRLFNQVQNAMMQDRMSRVSPRPSSGKMRMSDTPAVRNVMQSIPNRLGQQSQPFSGFTSNVNAQAPMPQSQPFSGFTGNVMGNMQQPQLAPRPVFRSPEASFQQMQNNIGLYRNLGQPSPMATNRAFIIPPNFGY